jgi:hypothetical protein
MGCILKGATIVPSKLDSLFSSLEWTARPNMDRLIYRMVSGYAVGPDRNSRIELDEF